MALCSTCRDIFADDLDDKWTDGGSRGKCLCTPHLVGDRLRESAEAGCFICKRVWEKYLDRPESEEWTQSVAELTPPIERAPWYHLWIYHATEEGSDPDRVSTEIVVEQADSPAYELGAAAMGSGFTGDEENLTLARHWMARCLSQHNQCARNANPQWFPTRLLKISAQSALLITTSEQRPKGPYATLSHCWGTEPFDCLTAENKADYEAGIPRRDFLPTFRDAMQVAERLGIEYLWIDSYCIIQSSHSGTPSFNADKMAEIATMSSVYANAILNIGAAHGQSPRAGCFTQRPPTAAEARQFAWRPGGKHSEAMYTMRSSTDYGETPRLYRQQALFKRAWFMQERLLTPRMLHFTDTQLCWECRGTRFASETLPRGMPERTWALNLGAPPFSLDDAKDAWDLWKNLVQTYSQLQLTWPAHDKLLALGALAQRTAERYQDTYAAGTFRQNMLRCLCWHPIPSSSPHGGRIQDSGVPSWSWASSNYPVSYITLMNDNVPLASVEQVDVELRDSTNPFGAVHGCKLSLRGRLLPTQLLLDIPPPNDFKIGVGLTVSGIDVERAALDEVIAGVDDLQRLQGRVFFFPLFWGLGPREILNQEANEAMSIQDVFELAKPYRQNAFVKKIRHMLGLASPDFREMLEKYSIHGLLLVKQEDGSFKRWGMFDAESATVLENSWATAQEQIINLT